MVSKPRGNVQQETVDWAQAAKSQFRFLVLPSCFVVQIEACFNARGIEGKRVPCGHFGEAESDPKMGAFTEYND
jgi:hypothetical protein